MLDKKILLIAHYFSPLNVTGSKRPEALSRYIAGKGGQVTILTTVKDIKNFETKNYDNKIKTIESSIFTTNIYRGINVNKEDSQRIGESIIKSSLIKIKHKVVNRYLGQIFDYRLLFLINICIKAVIYKRSNGYFFSWMKNIFDADLVISTAPPWPCHVLGITLAKICGIKCVVDYRDQFSENHMFGQSFGFIEKVIDKYIVKNAALVISVSAPMMDYYQKLSKTKNLVVMNGYDENVFALNNFLKKEKQELFTINYFGTITSDRLMPNLWRVIELRGIIPRIKFNFYGNNELLRDYLIKNHKIILEMVNFNHSVNHSEAMRIMKQSDMLLFTETSEVVHASQKGVLTTKLFEYLGSCRPIFAVINKNTIAGKLIVDSGLGYVISNDGEELYENLLNINKGINVNPNYEHIKKYSRASQFEILEDELFKDKVE